MNLRSQIRLRCYGTSEGVSKAWESRHAEYGNFDRDYSEAGKKEHYRANNSGVTVEWDGKGNGSVYEGSSFGKGDKVYQGPESGVRQHLSNRYGIGNAVGYGMPSAPYQPFRAAAAGGQTDSSSFVGRKYTVVDTHYGHPISEWDDPDSAEKAATGRPYSKVLSRPLPQFTPKVRDMARQRLVKTNPDVD